MLPEQVSYFLGDVSMSHTPPYGFRGRSQSKHFFRRLFDDPKGS